MNYLDINSPISEIQICLSDKGWTKNNEQIIAVEKPGEGNMNVVLRVITDYRSFILKQSRPFVQKYQQIEAPLERIGVEQQFYKAIQSDDLQPHTPKILGYDAINYILILEDLGNCEDMSSVYQLKNVSDNLVKKLTDILKTIHESDIPSDFPDNLEMRKLNHQHIFELPFLVDNGFSLDDIQPGLQVLSIPYKNDTILKETVSEIGSMYLQEGNTLLHGDYYPGSWMTEKDNLYVIDPEFAFVGFAEFDLGVMAGHLLLATNDEGNIENILQNYDGPVDKKLVKKMAGIEIMRRIIGLAQLSLKRTLVEKEHLLKLAHKLITA